MKLSIFFLAFFIVVDVPLWAQIDPFLIDTLYISKKELNSLNDKFKNLSISGYVQAQYQRSNGKGIESYNGGDFGDEKNNRFMIRRGRMRIDYTLKNTEGYRKTNLVFQFDATERGVFMRDMFVRIFENKYHNFILSSGMFNRPFGYELQMSSALRESPERGRMSQILMRTERDLGAMISFRPQNKSHKLYFLNADLGVFNGTGLTAPFDYDNFKDVIGRISINDVKPFLKNLQMWAGISYLNGGIGTNNTNVNEFLSIQNIATMFTDSSFNNLSRRLPREYFGADFRVRLPITKLSSIELRSEYIFGRQTSLALISNTPTSLPAEPTYVRSFDGAYFYFVTTLLNVHQFVIKYDWYDPNTNVNGPQIISDNGFSKADIRYHTFGVGYTYFFNPLTKVLLYYEMPRNETAALFGFDQDIKDNTFTIRTQLLF